MESENSDALADAVTKIDKINAAAGYRTDEHVNGLFFLYEGKEDADIFTPENLQTMCNTESAIALDPNFLDFCRLQSGECEIPTSSIVQHFYEFASISQWNCDTLLSSTVVDTKKAVFYSDMVTPSGQEQWGFFLAANSVDKGYSSRTESMWYVGSPLDGFDSVSDREDEQVRTT